MISWAACLNRMNLVIIEMYVLLDMLLRYTQNGRSGKEIEKENVFSVLLPAIPF